MYKLVIFNFDGVLADTSGVLDKVYERLSSTYEMSNMSKKDIESIRKLSPFDLFKAFHVPFYKLPKFIQDVMPVYKELVSQAPLFEGMRELVEALNEKGVTCIILSSNNPNLIHKFLKHHDFEVFDKVVGGAAVLNKQTRLNSVVRTYKVNKSETLYIGDERHDIEACKKVRVPIAAVTWGYDDYKVLGAGRPKYLIQDIEDLKEVFNIK